MIDLEDWVVPRLTFLYSHPEITDLVDNIEFGLAEIYSGIRTEQEFKELLHEAIIDRPTFSWYPSEPNNYECTSSSNTFPLSRHDFTASLENSLQSVHM